MQRRDFLKVAAATPLLGFTPGKPDEEPEITYGGRSTLSGTVIGQCGTLFALCTLKTDDGREMLCGVGSRVWDIYSEEGEVFRLLEPGARVGLIERDIDQYIVNKERWEVSGSFWEINDIYVSGWEGLPALSKAEREKIEQRRASRMDITMCPNCDHFWLRCYIPVLRNCPCCGQIKPWADIRLA